MNSEKVMVIGSGGREHALGWKLSQSVPHSELFFAPGNGGTGLIGKNVDISPDDIDGLVGFAADEQIGMTVVGPEGPLANGVVNAFNENRLKIFGPTRDAAQLESSKAW